MANAIPAASAGTNPTWTLADRLRKAREDAGLEQGELASVAGISRATISAAENGHRTPSRANLAMWAMATGVSREWLLGDPGPDSDPNLVRMTALSAVIIASQFEKSAGHAEALTVLKAVAVREDEVQAAGEWEASSAIQHPEVDAWCASFRPEIAAKLRKLVGPTGLEPMTSTVEVRRLAIVTPIRKGSAA